ncbi:putative amidase AmiB2 [Streptomyces subrutilus]|uniref:Amidase n=1 Tax=Streptomyces subrutilus TaxID=36818 RepID=A0A5P2UGF9_9ACTN|nr:amidase [Streptomyces subrutilus]QEU78040.1 amidase [Streptomyces subrutilus]GGZ56617.1 putative amidase AmiB2 [Streptomyces subrutilus]
MDDTELILAGVARQAELVRTGAVSARRLVEASLARIERLDRHLGAFRVVRAAQALAEADARDAARAAGAPAGPLEGVPVAVKDELDVTGEVTTFGGAANRTPAARDSEAVRRLRAAGAVVVGKTTMPEFGQWPFTESAAYGYTRNPWDTARTPGGSSGGSAAAVAAGLATAALGGDGGGSLRIPAACCGLFALKPQRGRVSTAPHPHLWHALGTVGPLTRTVLDSALLYDVLAGPAAGDRWTARPTRTGFAEAARTEPGRLRIGYSAKPAAPGVRPHPEHVRALHATVRALRELGHDVRPVDPRYPDTTAAFVPQFGGGVRFEAAGTERPDLVERRTRQTLLLARLTPEPVVARAVRAGERMAVRANQVFQRIDLLLTPTVAARPGPVGALDGAGMLRAAVRSLPMIAYTALWNVTGNPAASVPAGFGSDGLPLAVQLVGREHDETTVVQVAAQLEAVRPWAGRLPDLAR